MKWTRLGVALAVLLTIAFAAPAWAQGTKKATGTLSAVSGSSITVKSADGKDMTFTVDKDTKVQTPGGGTKTRQAQASGEAGPKLSDVLKEGEAVEVTYHEMNGAMHASEVRTMAKAPAAPDPTKVAHNAAGKVKDVSASSLTVTDKAGKDWTFSVDAKTMAIGKGMGTATKDTGGKGSLADLVKAGDTVSVTYHDMGGGTLHAATVRVTAKAATK